MASKSKRGTPEQRAVLEDFAVEFSRCWLCGAHRLLQIHHIARGCNRERGRFVRANLIRTCADCHRDKLDSMPVAQQLAIKREHDSEWYSRMTVNVLRGRQPDAISESDVTHASEVLR